MTQSARDLFQMSEKQFDQIYRQVLEPQLEQLEGKRRTAKKLSDMRLGIPWLVLLTIIVATLTLGFDGLFFSFMSFVFLGLVLAQINMPRGAAQFKKLELVRFSALLFSPIVIAIIVYPFLETASYVGILVASLVTYFLTFIHLMLTIKINRYSDTYKSIVIPQMLKHAGADLHYTSRPQLSVQTLQDSGLFNKKISSVVAEDGIRGSINGIELNVAEITASTPGSKSQNIFFVGLFCKANYPEKFKGWAWVYPKSEIVGDGTKWGNLFAEMGIDRFESPNRIQVNDNRFESIFRVYGSSEDEVKTVLTPKLMNNLIQLYDKSEKVALTFKEQTVYVALWTTENFLEPSLAHPAADPKILYTKLSDLETMLSIIEDLNLQYY